MIRYGSWFSVIFFPFLLETGCLLNFPEDSQDKQPPKQISENLESRERHRKTNNNKTFIRSVMFSNKRPFVTPEFYMVPFKKYLQEMKLPFQVGPKRNKWQSVLGVCLHDFLMRILSSFCSELLITLSLKSLH